MVRKESGAWLVGNGIFGVFPNDAFVIVWIETPDASLGINKAVRSDEITHASI